MTKDNEPIPTTQHIVVDTSTHGAVIVNLPITVSAAGGSTGFLGSEIKVENGDSESVVTIPNVSSILTSSVLSSVKSSHATLQSLLAAPISAARVIGQPENIQIITLPSASDIITTSQPDGAGRLWQVVPSVGNQEVAIIAVADPSEFIHSGKSEMGDGIDLDMQDATGDLSVTNADGMASILMPPPPPPSLPQNCPNWALRLNNCETIGESYRGYVESEVELDLLLTYHKQQTQSFWGTRQSPSPAKPSTRLMWKSQYVPFDGIPFVNIGSRAVVMECQYGPRRKGTSNKRFHDGTQVTQYRQTCPARIYIKKVRKFPEYAVDLQQDKKALRIAMDKAFHELRDCRRLEGWGQERFYVQLPTEKAHEYHDDSINAVNSVTEKKVESKIEVLMEGDTATNEEEDISDVRLHPKVAYKIRSLVAGGETRVYAIRKQLRSYVLREMFAGLDTTPERHDLTLFPTVNDLKNHIHQALKDIENGTLPLTASTVNVEILSGENADSEDGEEKMSSIIERTIASSIPMPETVTVTLTQNPDEEGHHIISRIETHLSDGTTQVSTTLTPETAHLLSKLHPGIFPAGTLSQLQLSSLSTSQSNTEDLQSDANINVGVDVAETLNDATESSATVVLSSEGDGGIIENSSEVMHAVNPDTACPEILSHSSLEDQAVMPVEIAVEVPEEDGVIVTEGEDEERRKEVDGVMVGDAEMITISMTDDNHMVLATHVGETFESQ